MSTRLVLVGLAAAVLAAGCASRPLSSEDRIEALMQRNRELEDRLLAARERAAGAPPEPAPAPERPEDPFRVIGVRFGRFTGGLAEDGGRGRDRLKVVLEPFDAEGDTVKRVGGLELRLGRVRKGLGPEPIHTWTFTRDEMRETWLSGLGQYAYVLKLSWPGGRPPETDRLHLEATFTTLDGRRLEATRPLHLAPAEAQ